MSLSVGNVVQSLNKLLTGSDKSWKDLTCDQKRQFALDLTFNGLVIPFSALSTLSSVFNFLRSNFFKSESEFLDKASERLNKLAYFINGIYGGLDNGFKKNLVGSLGYSLVSLSSILGNKENMYLLKGFGSALDQIPSTNEDLAYNPKIKNQYNLKDENETQFTQYTDFGDSVKKTFNGMKVVLSDICEEVKKEKASKGFLKALYEVFVKGKRRAEKNLVVSSIGIFSGSFLGTFLGLRKTGSSIRDIFGAHADIALAFKGDSVNKLGNSTGSNAKYKACGILYVIGSFLDLIYRWFGTSKLELAAVGVDNAGFMFMNWANRIDNRASKTREKNNEDKTDVETQLPGQTALATA